jgi:hypothetical protein
VGAAKDWFIKTVTLVNNAFFVYVDPVSWVNRHRLHHKFSDHAGDPNKLREKGSNRISGDLSIIDPLSCVFSGAESGYAPSRRNTFGGTPSSR